MKMKHAAITVSLVVGLVGAAAVVYNGLWEARYSEIIAGMISVAFMAYALVDVQRMCE